MRKRKKKRRYKDKLLVEIGRYKICMLGNKYRMYAGHIADDPEVRQFEKKFEGVQ